MAECRGDWKVDDTAGLDRDEDPGSVSGTEGRTQSCRASNSSREGYDDAKSSKPTIGELAADRDLRDSLEMDNASIRELTLPERWTVPFREPPKL